MDTRWQDKQIEVGKSLVEQGSQALRQGDVNTANSAFSEAEAIIDMVESPTDELLQIRARVLNETGFIMQRMDQTEKAIENHREATKLCRELIDRGVEFRANAAATHINLAGLLAGTGDLEGAREANERAVELADSLIDEGRETDHARNLSFGANQNYAMIMAKSEKWDEAEESMDRVLALVDSLADTNKGVHAQAAQGCQQLSVLMFHAGKYDDALKWGRHAESLSEKAYQLIGEPVLPVYVTSQVNLISYYEKAAAFADAEDCLFKALEVVGDHPQILLRGKAFYEECRTHADNRLEAGNLPRAEVDEGYSEILERIEEAGGLEELQEKVRESAPRQESGQSSDDEG